MHKYHSKLTENYPRLLNLAPYLSLIIVTGCVYWQVYSFEFLAFDDNMYVTENMRVKAGLSKEGILWAFDFMNNAAYWHPLTWLSHMTDCELFGLNPSGHHLINLLIHILNGIFLFYLLSITSKQWRPSLFVAFAFSLHPINVDSVAWVAERKNLLSTWFWLLAMVMYIRYCRRETLGSYSLVVLFYILGLMTKSMLVTLPFLLLLLDIWPLKRLNSTNVQHAKDHVLSRVPFLGFPPRTIFCLVLEKVPLFLLSALSVYISVVSIESYNPTLSLDTVSMERRVGNALVSYFVYIRKLLAPFDLAIYYPFPDSIPAVQVFSAGIFLGIISLFCISRVSTHPFLMVGWFWFLGTLVPVLGLFQQGLWPALADRWAYIPSIGLFIIAAWGGTELRTPRIFGEKFLILLAVVFVIAMGLGSWIQLSHWQNSLTLFEHTIKVTKNNYRFYNNLGKEFYKAGQHDKALNHFTKALEIAPGYAAARNNLGLIRFEDGKYAEAIEQFEKILETEPKNPEAHNNLGLIDSEQGDFNKARFHFRKALLGNPNLAIAHYNLGLIQHKLRKFYSALHHYREAARLEFDQGQIHDSIGNLWASQKKYEKAMSSFQEALKLHPKNAAVHNNLAGIFSLKGDFRMAEFHYAQAIMLKPDMVQALFNLGNLAAAKKEYHKAHSYFLRAYANPPRAEELLYRLGQVNARLQQFPEARKFYHELLRKNPDHELARQQLAELESMENFEK